jgi:hypothetical protein
MTHFAFVWVLVLASPNCIASIGSYSNKKDCQQAVPELAFEQSSYPPHAVRAFCVRSEKLRAEER